MQMPCFNPVQAWKGRTGGVVFAKHHGWSDQPLKVPCGGCIGCRMDYARDWAVRCMHEKLMNEDSMFVTLTYSDENLPKNGSLNPRDFTLFMKRLRKKFPKNKIRYFMCGEYGDSTQRPHYHALIFGLWFDDKTLERINDGNSLYESKTLDEIWRLGKADFGAVTFQSAGYVARYNFKKITGDLAQQTYGTLVPPFARMSRRPGIGIPWLLKFREDIKKDQIWVSGKHVPVPRAYDKYLEKEDPDEFEKIKRARIRNAAKQKWNNTKERLQVREHIATERAKLLIRSKN
jgi:hypothetical protein